MQYDHAAIRRALRAGSSISALSIAVMLTAGAASAQDATPQPGGQPDDGTTVEELVVTGFRASLASGIEAKRRENGVVDVIKAEDIADFPDNNLAESIQRIPGVAIDREGGEGRSISVRGLGPDFTRVRLNGIEALATTGGPDSGAGTNRGRGFDFNIFASELFSSITVRKTQAAEVEEGSLGATVDLQTSRPFDYKDFTFASSAQYGYNDLSKEWDPRVAFLVSDTWLDGKFGALLSVAYTKRHIREEGYNSTRWDIGTSVQGFCSPVGYTPQNRPNSGTTGTTAANCGTGVARPANTPGNVAAYELASRADVYHPRLPAYTRTDYDNDRLGVTGSFQFRPSDKTLLNVDVLLAKLDSKRYDTGLSAISFSRDLAVGGKPQTAVREAVVNDQNELVYGVFDNVDFRSSSTFSDITTEFTQYTVTLEQELTDKLRVNVLFGRAFSDFDNPVQTHATFERQNVQGFSWDYRGDQRAPELVLGFDPNDPAQWQIVPAGTPGALLSEIRLRPQGVENVLETVRADFTYDLTDDIVLKAGYAYKGYRFNTYENRRAQQDNQVLPLPAGTSIAQLSTRIDDFGSGLPVDAASGWVVPNIEAIARAYNIYCNCLQSGPAAGPGDYTMTGVTNGDARRLNQANKEDDTSAYVQGSFTHDLWNGMRLRGDLGLRYVKTEVAATGYQSRSSGTMVQIENEYEDWLPSVNLALDATDDIVLRFGAAKTMARPTLTSLNPGGSTTTSDRNNLRASAGNPFLEPFRATTYDVSAEWYFAPESLLSVAFFYKDISTYIQELIVQLPFNQGPLPLSILPAGFTGEEIFNITSFVNTEGGPLKGFEISYQQPFTFLPERFQFLPEWTGNFGTILNYTGVQSEITYQTTTAPTSGGAGGRPAQVSSTFYTNDLLNLSKSSYNATFYYEDSKLSARVSAAYRAGYLTRIPGQNNNDVEGKNSTFNVDASASYEVTDNVSLTFEGLNLTDEYNDRYVSSVRNSPSTYTHPGRQYYVGVRYRF